MFKATLRGVPDAEVIGVLPAGELANLGILASVPIIEPKWADERQWCGLVQAYLHGETEAEPSEWRACRSYRDGKCGGVGHRAACLFEEPESSAGWHKAKSWRYVLCHLGTRALTRREDVAEILDGQEV